MSSITLGKLESVDLREVWESEPRGFTPWLANPENLKLLADTIEIDLELEAQEKDVGPFRADILCKDRLSDAWVLIENQLETTDHTHLGQLLTYASGLKAVTIVWIARRFTEEHRAALDWLNEITDERFNFFGLEVELWKIGTSPVAPKFNIICKPNDWSKSVSEGKAQIERGELTEAKSLQLQFWTEFRQFLEATSKVLRPTKPAPQQWMAMSLHRSGVKLSAHVSFWDSVNQNYQQSELRACVVLDGHDSKAIYAMLAASKPHIEQEMGEPLIWHHSEGKRMCRVYVRRSADLQNREQWPDYRGWLMVKLEKLHDVVGRRIRELPPVVLPE